MDQAIQNLSGLNNPSLVLDDTIVDVNKSTSDYIFHSHKQTTIIVCFVITAYIIIAALVAVLNGFAGEAPAYIFGPAVAGFFVFILLVYTKVRHLFYRQFAQANNFQYQKDGQLQLTGALFNLGHGRKTQDIITGTYDDNPLVLFNYTYTIGSGKNQQTYNDTVFQIEYPSILAPILLVVDNQYFGGITGLFGGWEKIKPEGNFDDTFDLYTKKEFEIEALQVFSPDFMVKMLEQWPEFNLEFNGNKLIVFHNHTITTKAELQKMYDLVQFLITKIEPQANRMAGSVEALEALQNGKQ